MTARRVDGVMNTHRAVVSGAVCAETVDEDRQQPRTRAADPGRAPAFNAVIYTLDLLIPIIDFGQRKAYLPPTAWQQAITYGLVAFGWILATTIAAGLTRALRRQ